ncbi:MAG: fatty acid cis/trans isomerase [Campylobacterota bacterium]|nr:fatty acid cis/trans isomerase [Campylobacterota bacterium]
MKHLYILLSLFLALLFLGCSAPIPEPVKIDTTHKQVSYLKDVKPILDKRCVSCHSCYNSPCQSKFSSYEGVDRGGSKLLVYNATRLRAADPTRLFIDAKNTEEWHNKGFYSLTKNFDANTSYNDSIMMQMLHDKKVNPEVIGSYDPEYDDLICPRDSQEMGEYFEEKPNHGMPYGFPAIKESEYQTLAAWLHQGAQGPTAQEQHQITSPSSKALTEIKKWEAFLNTPDPKHSVTARYLYEHLYLAHWNFTEAPQEFYEIVRSKTAYPEAIDVIPTVRPFDDPKSKFYYRIQRIHSTIVHKTHMVVEFDDAKLERMNELFIKPKWVEKPHYIDYHTKSSANPFVAFFQIPVKARYQFMLDHSHYIVMTFIRGPVCRGQMALNVIHDHFWVMFQDPEYDISIQQPGFLLRQANNLAMPIETSTQRLLDTFSDAYRKRYEKYFIAKQKLYDRAYPQGLPLDSIWRGNTASDAPLLTIYRHFNSASVHKGVLGGQPRTMWVIDYPQLERIYYSLVAGYDVFGNVSHQTNIRRYMDFLRLEGELNFISYLPQDLRLKKFKSWYIGDSDVEEVEQVAILNRETAFDYKTVYPQSELIEYIVDKHILKSTNIAFDNLNYYSAGEHPPAMPQTFSTLEDFQNGARSLTAPGTGFITRVVEGQVNNALIRITMPDGSDKVMTLVVNRWHDNVNSLFRESDNLNPMKDTIDFIDGSIGSYPNMFIVLDYKELPDFFDLIKNYDASETYEKKIAKYFISRSNEEFWETFDWFQEHFNQAEPLQAGLYDLNRYYHKGW